MRAPALERKIVGQGITEQQGTERDGGGDAHAAEEDFDVNGIGDEGAVIVESPLMDDEAVADQPETVGEHERVGEEQEKADPEQRRQRDDRFVGARVHFSGLA